MRNIVAGIDHDAEQPTLKDAARKVCRAVGLDEAVLDGIRRGVHLGSMR